jgi:hypothetical protein
MVRKDQDFAFSIAVNSFPNLIILTNEYFIETSEIYDANHSFLLSLG